MKRFVVIVAMCAMSLPFACSHATLEKPRARNVVAAQECQGGKDCPEFPPACGAKVNPGCRCYAPQSMNANGPPTIKSRGDKTWPSPIGAFGLCGDPEQRKNYVGFKEEAYMLPTPVQATYTAGEIVTFEVKVYVEHLGHYEFRICDKGLDASKMKDHQEGEDCLKKWVLKRAPPSGSKGDSQPIDTKHPGRWYIGASASKTRVNMLNGSVPIAGPHWNSTRDAVDLKETNNNFVMRYIIPEDLECEACTLQWYWPTANTCAYDADVGDYFKRNGMDQVGSIVPCGTNGYGADGEEFWNCADIKVLPKKKPTPPPTPSPGGRRRRRRSTRRRSPGGGRRRRRSSTRRRTKTRRRSSRRRTKTRRRSSRRRR